MPTSSTSSTLPQTLSSLQNRRLDRACSVFCELLYPCGIVSAVPGLCRSVLGIPHAGPADAAPSGPAGLFRRQPGLGRDDGDGHGRSNAQVPGYVVPDLRGCPCQL